VTPIIGTKLGKLNRLHVRNQLSLINHSQLLM